MKQCPRCASEINDFDSVCPRCGLPIEGNSPKQIRKNKRLAKKEEKKLQKQKNKEEKQQKFVSQTDFEKFTSTENMTKKQAQDALVFDVDENGEFDIDTSDVELVDKETQELLKQREQQTYSIKKARGDYKEPKIKWWEIYKLANRSFARRKIRKEVNKAAKIKPDFVSKSKLLLLCIFLGWFGTHDFYAKNKKKGWFSLICLVLWMGIVALAPSSTFFASIELSIGGCAGFIVLMMWISDIVNIIFNNYKYKVQKVAFISKLNVETRAKLGEKYIDMELYQKPWWIRLKVWLEKKRRDYAEYKHNRRQKLIEKEKAKQSKLAEQEKINDETIRFEIKEEEANKSQKIIDSVDVDALNEIKAINKDFNKKSDADESKESFADDKNETSKPLNNKNRAKIKISTKKNKK